MYRAIGAGYESAVFLFGGACRTSWGLIRLSFRFNEMALNIQLRTPSSCLYCTRTQANSKPVFILFRIAVLERVTKKRESAYQTLFYLMFLIVLNVCVEGVWYKLSSSPVWFFQPWLCQNRSVRMSVALTTHSGRKSGICVTGSSNAFPFGLSKSRFATCKNGSPSVMAKMRSLNR